MAEQTQLNPDVIRLQLARMVAVMNGLIVAEERTSTAQRITVEFPIRVQPTATPGIKPR